MGIDVVPVEGPGLFGRGAHEALGAVDDLGVVPLQERRRRAKLVEPRRSLIRDRDPDLLSVVKRRRPADHRTVDGALDVERDDLRSTRCGARGERGLGVGPLIHRDAMAINRTGEIAGVTNTGPGGDGQASLRVAKDLNPLVDEV